MYFKFSHLSLHVQSVQVHDCIYKHKKKLKIQENEFHVNLWKPASVSVEMLVIIFFLLDTEKIIFEQDSC